MNNKTAILHACCVRPRRVRDFTHNTELNGACHPLVVQRYFDELEDEGLIEPFGADRYRATEAGVAVRCKPVDIAGPRTICSNSQPNWTAPKWTPPRGESVRHPSRGIG